MSHSDPIDQDILEFGSDEEVTELMFKKILAAHIKAKQAAREAEDA